MFSCPPSSSPFEEWTTCPRYGQPQFALPLHARVVWGFFKLIKFSFEFLVHAPNVWPCPLLMLQRSHAMSCIRWLQTSPNCCKVYGISGSACVFGCPETTISSERCRRATWSARDWCGLGDRWSFATHPQWDLVVPKKTTQNGAFKRRCSFSSPASRNSLCSSCLRQDIVTLWAYESLKSYYCWLI